MQFIVYPCVYLVSVSLGEGIGFHQLLVSKTKAVLQCKHHQTQVKPSHWVGKM